MRGRTPHLAPAGDFEMGVKRRRVAHLAGTHLVVKSRIRGERRFIFQQSVRLWTIWNYEGGTFIIPDQWEKRGDSLCVTV